MKKVSTTGNNHIVQIIGCILSEPPIAMVMEYVPFGDLRSNLVQWKEQVYTYQLVINDTIHIGWLILVVRVHRLIQLLILWR